MPWRIAALALAALSIAGCGSHGLALPVDGGGRDGALDLAVPDLAVRDFGAAPIDLADGELGPCGGGFLNSDLGAACPLGCGAMIESVPDEGRLHVAFGAAVTYQHNPPASGMHWPSPAPWGVHPEVVPREWWVHNLEHGGIVLLYNCPALDGGPPTDASVPDACPNLIAFLSNIYYSWPQDNWFDAFFETRILVTPDPLLPGTVAAVAWDWTYVTNNLDPNVLNCFMQARYGRGPENAP
jgi:hypothetical protein